MTYWRQCDWCGKHLDQDDDHAEMPVTIHHPGGRSRLDARWAEETKPTRFFCAAPRPDTDRDGRDRAGLVPDTPEFTSCYDRAIAAITGTKLSDPGMGLEWRLVAVGEHREPTPRRRPGDGETIAELEIGVRAYNALLRAGIGTVGQLRALVDEGELWTVRGLGQKAVTEIMNALDTFDMEDKRTSPDRRAA